MKKIAILACKMIREQNLCPADSKCLVALLGKDGAFERYKNEDVSILGIMDCGGCEGNKTRAICSLLLFKTQLATLKENIDVLHIGTCMMKFSPKKDDIIAAVKEKARIKVVEGTHKYAPQTIFGE
ncbi:Predicted metal-binding protein [Candidatus Kryptobacter tengchongensis]|uniref:Predicted metal-binding protein n=1 Tax=Kryptobacter tengchongensis TaxID=1643429 RepID=A0A916LHT6_KRYT1|nr:CGGC domain-containing protein [Candidatus Kryptobacter tengchongensis]CUS96155.1 Predicted metal-binding protein [Candidatus Kryptobacter tengchongensis]CUU02986.1 Predicted metal-binding protein [Candidatus Kryptobacter tengchongensis]